MPHISALPCLVCVAFFTGDEKDAEIFLSLSKQKVNKLSTRVHGGPFGKFTQKVECPRTEINLKLRVI
jgi:hypothetical protein